MECKWNVAATSLFYFCTCVKVLLTDTFLKYQFHWKVEIISTMISTFLLWKIVAFFLNQSFLCINVNQVSHYNIAYSRSTIQSKRKITVQFNLNNNKISKELLDNKFNIILNNKGRRVLNDQKTPSPHNNEPQRSSGFVQKQPPEVFCKKAVLKSFANFTGKHLHWSLL